MNEINCDDPYYFEYEECGSDYEPDSSDESSSGEESDMELGFGTWIKKSTKNPKVKTMTTRFEPITQLGDEILEYVDDMITMTVEDAPPINKKIDKPAHIDSATWASNYILYKFSDNIVLFPFLIRVTVLGIKVMFQKYYEKDSIPYRENNLFRYFMYFFNQQKRFAIIPLFVGFPLGGHANMVIYDRYLNTIEIFDPHGRELWFFRKAKRDIYDKICNILEKLNVEKPVLIKSIDICPNIGKYRGGPQVMAENLYTGTRYQGNCLIWAFIFLDLRLAFPDVNPTQMMNLVLSLGGKDLSDLVISYFWKIREFKNGPYEIIVDGGEEESPMIVDYKKR